MEKLACKGVLLPWKPKLFEKFVNFDKNVFVGGGGVIQHFRLVFAGI